MTTKSLMKLKIKKLQEFWKKENIELLPIKEGKLYRMQFKFIEEDYTVKNSNLTACDNDAIYFNAAIYAANFLYDNKKINNEVYNTYINEIKKLYNTTQFYS